MREKIKVTSAQVAVHAYGAGASVSALYTTATEEEGRRLEQALRDMVEEVKPEAEGGAE
jgi:hypothetical protein